MARCKNKDQTCSIHGCGKRAYSRGYCVTHYGRYSRHGDPLVCLATPKFAAHNFLIKAASYQGSECLIWPYRRDNNGYGRVSYDGHRMTASRAVCILANGPPDGEKLVAAHSCGNGHLGCVNPNHIRWATYLENSADAVEHERIPRGEKSWKAKLTDAEVLSIRQSNEPTAFLAQKFTISRSHIHSIKSGRRRAA